MLKEMGYIHGRYDTDFKTIDGLDDFWWSRQFKENHYRIYHWRPKLMPISKIISRELSFYVRNIIIARTINYLDVIEIVTTMKMPKLGYALNKFDKDLFIRCL